MSRYLLDTDWIVDDLNGQAAATETLLKLAPWGLAVSLISYAELYEGAYFSRDPPVALAAVQTFLTGTVAKSSRNLT